MLASLLRAPLYVPQLSSVLPYALAEAGRGDFTALVALSAAISGGASENFAVGMHFAVICAEDVPRIDAAAASQVSAARFGSAFAELYRQACRLVPSRAVPPEFYSVPASKVPVLIFLRRARPRDAATPWRFGRATARQRQAHRRTQPRPRHQRSRLRTDAGLALCTRCIVRSSRRRLSGANSGAELLCRNRPHRGAKNETVIEVMIEVISSPSLSTRRSTASAHASLRSRTCRFVAADGRITAMLGPNGAGKTTTLRIIGTLVKADRGQARVGGIDVQADTRAVRAQLGVLSDARGLYTRLTARENVEYYAQLRNVPARLGNERLAKMAELLDMGSLLDRRVEGFSTGERLKVALARALIHDPHHLVLDEPTNGLDVVSTRALRRLLLHLRDTGKCIVISSHIMQEVDQLADEIVIVARGRTVSHGTAQQIRAEAGTESLEDAFVKLAYESSGRAAGARMHCDGRHAATTYVFRKELKDALRDRRTWLIVLVTSILAGPLTLFLLSIFIASVEEGAAKREIYVANAVAAPTLINFLQRAGATVKDAPDDYAAQIKSGRLQNAVIVVPDQFEQRLAAGETIRLPVTFDETATRAQPATRATLMPCAVLRANSAFSGCWHAASVPQVLAAVEIEEINVASSQARGAQLLFLIPWLALLGSVAGAISVAIDVTAGERERGSLEPLLMNPVEAGAVVLRQMGGRRAVLGRGGRPDADRLQDGDAIHTQRKPIRADAVRLQRVRAVHRDAAAVFRDDRVTEHARRNLRPQP